MYNDDILILFYCRSISIITNRAAVAVGDVVLVREVLEEAVLVPVQVIHQIAIATVLCYQVQRT